MKQRHHRKVRQIAMRYDTQFWVWRRSTIQIITSR